MKILLICDHYPLSPRVKKVRDTIIELNPSYNVAVVCWNRNNINVEEDYVISYNQLIGYGRRLKKLFNLYNFFKFVREYCIEYHPQFIHSIDFEMLFISSFFKYKSNLIYEVYDIKFFSNTVLNMIREKIEYILVSKRVDKMIVASPFFEEYYKNIGIENVPMHLLNNKPTESSVESYDTNYLDKYLRNDDSVINVAFVGTIRYREILQNMIQAAKEVDNIHIYLIGGGPDFEYFDTYTKENNLEKKVTLTGRFTSSDLYSIYKNIDFVWAVYPNKDKNVQYAISNKYFESLSFNKPIIVANRTRLGELVEQLKCGISVDPYSVFEIQSLFSKLGEMEFIHSFQNQKDNYWESESNVLSFVYLNREGTHSEK